METKPMRKSTDKVLKSYRSLIDFRSPRARPAWLNNNGEVRRLIKEKQKNHNYNKSMDKPA